MKREYQSPTAFFINKFEDFVVMSAGETGTSWDGGSWGDNPGGSWSE